jgi:hypothetical protein
MAKDAKKQLDDLNEQIDSLYKRLGRMDTPPVFDEKQIGAARREIQKLKVDLDEVNNSLSYISKSFRDSIAELSTQNTELGYAKKSLKSIEKIARDIAYENQQGLLIDDNQLKNLEKKAKLEYESLRIAVESGRLAPKVQQEFEDNLSTQKEFEKTMARIRETTKKIKGDIGVKTFGFMDDLTKKIPGLSALSDPFKEASEASQKMAKSNLDSFGEVNPKNLKMLKGITSEQKEGLKVAMKSGDKLTKGKIKELGIEKLLTSQKGKQLAGSAASKKAGALFGKSGLAKSATSPLRAGLKVLGPAISKMLTKALGPVGLLVELFMAIKASDKIVADMAKNFGISYNEALGMKQEMTSVAQSSGSIFVTSKGISETFSAINKSLGTNSMLSEDMAVEFTKLRTMAGFTNDELKGLAGIMIGSKKSTKEVTGEFLAQAKISSTQNGVLLNEQQLLKEIGNISYATTLSLGKNPGLIAEAAATAKSLGMELSKVEGIADSMLDFESSISNELQAELLLGKDINLEKARQFALDNNIAGVAREINKQIGSSKDFTKLNRIQQDALAKSVGMSREELAKTLATQAKLQKLTGKNAEQAKKDFETLKARVGEEEALRILEEKGADGLSKQVGMADKFSATIDKLKEIFVVVGEALMPVFDVLVSVFKIIGPIMKGLSPVFRLITLIGNAIGDVLSMLSGDFSFSGTKSAFGNMKPTDILPPGFAAIGEFAGVPSMKEIMMANGGVVTGPTRAVVGEAGPEAVIPLSDNSPMIKQANKTNELLATLIGQNSKKPELSPVGLYEVQ